MTRYALLLRGVNVGKGNSLPMVELRSMLEDVGSTNVQTCLQSGNAVFETALPTKDLTNAIEEALENRMGRRIATTLRTRAQMRALVAANPFLGIATNLAHLCVTFLSVAPKKSDLAPLQAENFEPELYQVVGREIFTWHPNGQGRSALAVALGKLPGPATVTTRNWNTVQRLLVMLDEG